MLTLSGVGGPKLESKEAAPNLLDDFIMNYKYLNDSMMRDCFEKSLKKLRCLLRFYIMLITPQTPLMKETWKAMRDMDLLSFSLTTRTCSRPLSSISLTR
jgi:hypothetical protein